MLVGLSKHSHTALSKRIQGATKLRIMLAGSEFVIALSRCRRIAIAAAFLFVKPCQVYFQVYSLYHAVLARTGTADSTRDRFATESGRERERASDLLCAFTFLYDGYKGLKIP